MSNLILLTIAAIAGATMAVQGSVNSAMSKVTGVLEANLIVHLIGTGVLVILLFVIRMGKGSFANAGGAPWYAWSGGILSILILYGVMTSMPKLGASIATTAIIVGQVLTACFIDHFGLFGFDKAPLTWWKLLGVAMLAGGARILLI